jgi:hypothetical protein
MDRAQICARLFRGRFPWGCDGITILGWVLVGHTWVTTQNSHNFWADSWNELKFIHEFLEAISLGVAMDSLLGALEVRSGQTESNDLKGPKLLIWQSERAQNFARVSIGQTESNDLKGPKLFFDTIYSFSLSGHFSFDANTNICDECTRLLTKSQT